LESADPMAFYIGNVVKRVLHIIREAAKELGVEITPSIADPTTVREEENQLKKANANFRKFDSLKDLFGKSSIT
jgi:hypothetical protein